MKLEDREKQELDFAKLYASEFAHGTSGHIGYMLVAKLSNLLDRLQDREAKIQYLIDIYRQVDTSNSTVDQELWAASELIQKIEGLL